MSEEVKDVIEEVKDTSDELIEKMEVKGEKSEEVSKSWAKREARKAEVKASKRKATFGKIVETVIGIAIAGAFIAAIVLGIIQSANTITPANNYSAGLDADGYIKGEDLSAVKDLGLSNLSVPAAEIAYSDEQVQADIDSLLSTYKSESTDSSLTVASGDTINLDYDGSIDGVAFEGGSSNGAGYNLEIGSGNFIPGFEDQLIGTHPGDQVTVNVTFPEDYQNAEVAGKAAVFECTVNSIVVTPELTDEFVAEKCSDRANTIEELRAYYKERGEENNLETYITTYISENAEASKMPKSFLKNEQSLLYYSDEQTYNYYNSYYSQMLGYSLYGSFSDFTGMTDAEYQKDLKSRAKTNCAQTMTYESVFKNNNLSVTDDQYSEAETMIKMSGVDTEACGPAYIKALAMRIAALEFIKENATIQ